jgi:FkbM family methyltransferase
MGVEIRRYRPTATANGRLNYLIRDRQVDLVIDVGANEGQFVLELRQSGFRGRVISFEPLSAAHAVLERRAAADVEWRVFRRAAVSDTNGTTHLNIAANSVSSSILPMLPLHAEAAPYSKYCGTESVEAITLDTALAQAGTSFQKALLKIDTQGAEELVLRGAEESLRRVAALQLEMSIQPLYEGQLLFKDTVEFLERRGFQLYSLEPGFRDLQSGRLLQFDGLFVRCDQIV